MSEKIHEFRVAEKYILKLLRCRNIQEIERLKRKLTKDESSVVWMYLADKYHNSEVNVGTDLQKIKNDISFIFKNFMKNLEYHEKLIHNSNVKQNFQRVLNLFLKNYNNDLISTSYEAYIYESINRLEVYEIEIKDLGAVIRNIKDLRDTKQRLSRRLANKLSKILS